MRRFTSLIAALFFLTVGFSTAQAALLHWDINGATAGASGGATATGAWNNTATNWNTNSTGGAGTIQAWTSSADTAIFSAGTNATGNSTITASGTPVATGIIIEEGTITLSGRVDVNTGTVELQAGTQLTTANAGGVTGTGITFTAGGKYAITGNATLRTTNAGSGGSFVSSVATIALSNNAILTVNYQVANSLSIIQTASVISGSGGLTKTGVGVIAIASPSTYSGATTINDGELRIRGGDNRLPTGTIVTINSPGILNLNGLNQQVAQINGNGRIGLTNRTLTVNSGTFTGTIEDVANAGALPNTNTGGILQKNGTGALTLSGANTFTGGINFTNGRINFNHNSAAGTGVITVGSGADNIATTASGIVVSNNFAMATGAVPNLNVASGNSLELAGIVSGDGSLTKTSAGIGILSGNNSYTGGTTVTAGTLLVNNTTGSGTGTADVMVNGGTLGGTGSISGNVIVGAGTVAPGLSPGILTVGGVSLSATSALGIEIAGLNVGSEYDRLAVIGNASLDGTLNVSLLDGFMPQLGDSFTILTSAPVGVLGTFANFNAPSLSGARRWEVVYNTDSVVLNVVPEPGTLVLVSLGIAGICFAGRRRVN